jgi:hypothetical protein
MLHPSTELRFVNDIIGHGVFATEMIPMGTITWVRDVMDREFMPDQLNALPLPLREKVLTYSYRNNKGNYLLCWDHTKFINHSFDANCMTTPYGFEIAVRHIAAGEQLTNDYGTLNIIEPFEPFDEGHLRKVVCPDDLATYFPLWDVQVKDAIALVNYVEQPLQPVFADDKWLQVQRLCMGEESVESLKNCLLLPSIAVGFTQQQ